MGNTEKVTKTILSERVFEIEPFHKVFIADPLYLQQIKSGNTDHLSGMRKLMADFTIPVEQHIAKVHLRKVHLAWEGDPVENDMWEMYFYSVLDDKWSKEFPSLAFDNMYYADLVEQTGDLGCDTARYHIIIDGKTTEVYNGGDGYFGTYFTYKKGCFSFVVLSFPDELCDEKDLMHVIHSVFDVRQEELTQQDTNI